MSADSVLEKANDRGFRLHQCYQRYSASDAKHKDNPRFWYFDVVLVHTHSVWDYFHGNGETLEDALRDAYRKGKARVEYFESLTPKQKAQELDPAYRRQQIERDRDNNRPSRKRVRL